MSRLHVALPTLAADSGRHAVTETVWHAVTETVWHAVLDTVWHAVLEIVWHAVTRRSRGSAWEASGGFHAHPTLRVVRACVTQTRSLLGPSPKGRGEVSGTRSSRDGPLGRGPGVDCGLGPASSLPRPRASWQAGRPPVSSRCSPGRCVARRNQGRSHGAGQGRAALGRTRAAGRGRTVDAWCSFAAGRRECPQARRAMLRHKLPSSPPPQPWLADPKTPAWMARNVRLWYGRWLAQHRLFDEALEQLDGLSSGGRRRPRVAAVLPGVVYHRLLNRDAAMEALTRLLDADQGPRRYATVARLMEADLKDLKEDSLDHIARRMEDIERRLDLGRGGPKVRKIQDGVIQSLDKLIKELEEAQQQQEAAAAGENVQPTNPAKDSVPWGERGRRGNEAGRRTPERLGNLPPKQRDEASADRADFPATIVILLSRISASWRARGA